MQDQQSIIVSEFKGLYDRGELRDLNVTQIKPGFFKTLNNFYHQGESLVSRPGFAPLADFGATKLLRFWPYRHPTTAQDGFLMLFDTGAGLALRDSLGGPTLYNLVGGTDWQFFITRNMAFGAEISLNTVLQQPLGVVAAVAPTQLYRLNQLAAGFRPAAGVSPFNAAAMTAATSAAVGVVEAGVHLIAVAYETDTGFITPPGPFVATIYTPTQYTAPGGFRIDVANIPVGPANVSFKHILASKVIRPPFNGDVLVPELFFIPTSATSTPKIANATVATTVNFYDTGLVVSADYLLDELEVIPSGTGYCTYKNRLVIVGFNGANTYKGALQDTSYIARVSNPGQYESFSSIEGFIEVFQGDGDALQACWEQNGNLYLAKGNRTYVARDNGGPPNTWNVELVDAAIGCGPWGIARIDNTQNYLVEGGAIVGSRRGVYFFTGQYATIPLTYNIEAMYRRNVNNLAAYSDFFYSKYFYDSYRRLLYWLPQTISGTNKGSDYMLVGSCDIGLNPEAIRWSRFDSFSSRDSDIVGRFIRDIYTSTQSPNINYNEAMLFLIFDDGATAVADGNLNNTDIQAIRTFFSFDQQTTGLIGGKVNWELVTFPANVEELDKLQATNVRVLAKHNNNADPIDFELGAFDYTYDEFSATNPQFFGDGILRDMVLLPQLYDAPINVRSKLIGVAFSRGAKGGNIQGVTLGNITNSVFIHKIITFGNKAAQDKLRGSIR